jgi:hypothetical protein
LHCSEIAIGQLESGFNHVHTEPIELLGQP